jgi:hypothetical protein
MGELIFPLIIKKYGGIKMLVAGVWILAIGLILNFIVGATWNDRESSINYIDFKKSKAIDHIPTQIEELKKFDEEAIEFFEAVVKSDTLNAIEEYWDCRQAMENSLQIMGVSRVDIEEGYYRHIKKLKGRGWIFKG